MRPGTPQPSHRLFVGPVLPGPEQRLTIEGDEARHAVGVKRLHAGETVELLDGAGTVARAVVEHAGLGKRASLSVLIHSLRHEPPASPRVEVWSATPKGDRVDQLIDQLSQLGAAGWSPIATARGVVDPRPTKLDRLVRVAIEAAKQAGRAHLLSIGPSRTPADALAWRDAAGSGARVILADASGVAIGSLPACERTLILIGPEGGWTDQELAQAREHGWACVRFGPHAMRIETAAVAACAGIMQHASG